MTLWTLYNLGYLCLKWFRYLCLIPWSCTSPLNTGSTMSESTWGSSILVSNVIFWPFGPLAWTLYIQKCRCSFLLPPEEAPEVFSFDVDGLVPSRSLSSKKEKLIIRYYCTYFLIHQVNVNFQTLKRSFQRFVHCSANNSLIF